MKEFLPSGFLVFYDFTALQKPERAGMYPAAEQPD
jgi:hypothetical protein